MHRHRACVAWLAAGLAAITLFALTPDPPAAAQQRIGVVLMHGKQGAPNEPQLGTLWAALRNAGYLAALPEMCWSRTRIYDKPYLDCLAEVDGAVAKLKAQGATAIVIAGHSLGGNGALGYAARHEDLAGVIALAPAAEPRALARQPQVAASLAQARQLAAQGQGRVVHEFTDFNNTRFGPAAITVHATPDAFISFLSPEGPAEMAADMPRIKVPLLIVSGTRDPSQRGAAAQFALAPPNPLNKFVTVSADHMGTPDAAVQAVLAFLTALKS